jgi:hypothetical protein
MATLLDRFFGAFRGFPARRVLTLPVGPALERRAPQIAAEDYAARHLIEHTLDRKADLRRLAPESPDAARRYRQLLGYELEALHELTEALRSASGGPELAGFLTETAHEIERLVIEVRWCDSLLRRAV